jgi:hypothetical protein
MCRDAQAVARTIGVSDLVGLSVTQLPFKLTVSPKGIDQASVFQLFRDADLG